MKREVESGWSVAIYGHESVVAACRKLHLVAEMSRLSSLREDLCPGGADPEALHKHLCPWTRFGRKPPVADVDSCMVYRLAVLFYENRQLARHASAHPVGLGDTFTHRHGVGAVENIRRRHHHLERDRIVGSPGTELEFAL